jgi:hypothetical protein
MIVRTRNRKHLFLEKKSQSSISGAAWCIHLRSDWFQHWASCTEFFCLSAPGAKSSRLAEGPGKWTLMLRILMDSVFIRPIGIPRIISETSIKVLPCHLHQEIRARMG